MSFVFLPCACLSVHMALWSFASDKNFRILTLFFLFSYTCEPFSSVAFLIHVYIESCWGKSLNAITKDVSQSLWFICINAIFVLFGEKYFYYLQQPAMSFNTLSVWFSLHGEDDKYTVFNLSDNLQCHIKCVTTIMRKNKYSKCTNNIRNCLLEIVGIPKLYKNP